MSHKIIKYIAIWLVAAFSLVFTACGSNDEPVPPTAARTVLVYQVANNNLSTYAADDIREMLNGSQNGGIPDNSHLLVYSSNPGGITLSEIKKGTQTVLKTYADNSLSVTSERMREVFDDMRRLAPAADYGTGAVEPWLGLASDRHRRPGRPAQKALVRLRIRWKRNECDHIGARTRRRKIQFHILRLLLHDVGRNSL